MYIVPYIYYDTISTSLTNASMNVRRIYVKKYSNLAVNSTSKDFLRFILHSYFCFLDGILILIRQETHSRFLLRTYHHPQQKTKLWLSILPKLPRFALLRRTEEEIRKATTILFQSVRVHCWRIITMRTFALPAQNPLVRL